MNADEKAIATVLGDYEGALNRSDTAAVMKLYAPDGVFMPQHFPSNVGANAVRKAYDGVFRTITLDVKFAVAEIKQVGPDWAFARTNSAGGSLVIVFQPPTRRVHKVKRGDPIWP